MFIRYAAFHLQQLGIKKQKGKELLEIKEKCEDEVKVPKTKEESDDSKTEKADVKPTKSEKKSKKDNSKKEIVDNHVNDKNDDQSHNETQNELNLKNKTTSEKEILVNGDSKQDFSEDILEKSSDINAALSVNDSVDTDEAKKIVESITDSMSNGDKQESGWLFILILIFQKYAYLFHYYFLL